MHAHSVRRWLRLALLGVLAVGVVGVVVMALWNWLLPPLFGLQPIGFWQALGLLLLGRLLFGGMGGGGGHGRHWRRRMAERWERMTPEERERFLSGVEAHCRPRGPQPESTP